MEQCRTTESSREPLAHKSKQKKKRKKRKFQTDVARCSALEYNLRNYPQR